MTTQLMAGVDHRTERLALALRAANDSRCRAMTIRQRVEVARIIIERLDTGNRAFNFIGFDDNGCPVLQVPDREDMKSYSRRFIVNRDGSHGIMRGPLHILIKELE